MRLWHQKLIPFLDRQRLLGQHRECCALRGKGWGKKHATVDYVFTHEPARLVAYHWLVMSEMRRRGYCPDPRWETTNWRGDTLGLDTSFADPDNVSAFYEEAHNEEMIYPEHNDEYLAECISLLKDKNAPIDWGAWQSANYIF